MAEEAQELDSWRDDPVEVTVFLSSGQSLTGRVVRLSQESEHVTYVLLAQIGPSHAASAIPPVILFALEQVIALQIHDPQTAVQALWRQPQLVQDEGPAPSRLELKRALELTNEGMQLLNVPTRLECD